jgi:hypothetical protein
MFVDVGGANGSRGFSSVGWYFKICIESGLQDTHPTFLSAEVRRAILRHRKVDVGNVGCAVVVLRRIRGGDHAVVPETLYSDVPERRLLCYVYSGIYFVCEK